MGVSVFVCVCVYVHVHKLVEDGGKHSPKTEELGTDSSYSSFTVLVHTNIQI